MKAVKEIKIELWDDEMKFKLHEWIIFEGIKSDTMVTGEVEEKSIELMVE